MTTITPEGQRALETLIEDKERQIKAAKSEGLLKGLGRVGAYVAGGAGVGAVAVLASMGALGVQAIDFVVRAPYSHLREILERAGGTKITKTRQLVDALESAGWHKGCSAEVQQFLDAALVADIAAFEKTVKGGLAHGITTKAVPVVAATAAGMGVLGLIRHNYLQGEREGAVKSELARLNHVRQSVTWQERVQNEGSAVVEESAPSV